MSKFQGKWVTDLDCPRENMDKLMDEIGVDKALQEKVKDAVSTAVYEVNGNNVTITNSSTAFPGQERTVKFTAGVPFDSTGLDGSPYKATVTIQGDNVMTDEGKNDKYGEFKTVRTVEGNKMISKVTMAGMTACYQMKRA